MRGLDEIKKMNANPHADHNESLAYGNDRFTGGADFDHRTLPDRFSDLIKTLDADTDHGGDIYRDFARGGTVPPARNPDTFAELLFGGDLPRPAPHEVSKTKRDQRLGGLLLLGILADIASRAERKKARERSAIERVERSEELAAIRKDFPETRPDHMNSIATSPMVDEPPFFEFWKKLNAKRAEEGRPEAHYKDARELFSGGPVPVGAITFVGKEWDGIRSVPATPVKELGGTRPAYHGEYRTVDQDGTEWHKVLNKHDMPIAYALPEAALIAARDIRNDIVPTRHR